jgi:beta-mannosidase
MKYQAVLLFLFICCHQLMAQPVSLELKKNWQFRQSGKQQWYPATIPGTVHTDLLANKLIADPFYRDNENKVQWIESEEWEYRNRIDLPPFLFSKKHIDLVFDGLDTDAEVFLNGKKILEANNMFRQWVVDIKPQAKQAGNELLIRFHSSAKRARAKKAMESPTYPDNERIYVRKAQYQFGWDWGPRMVTCGIWKKVQLIGWDEARLGRIAITNISADDKQAEIKIEAEVYADKDLQVLITSKIHAPSAIQKSGNVVQVPAQNETAFLKKGMNKLAFTRQISNPARWPYAKDMYSSEIEIRSPGSSSKSILLDKSTGLYFGLRSVQLITDKDSIGTSFYFKLNGHPVFAKGSNWIPPDNFLPRAEKEKRYEQLLKAAKDAHINMLRVWGGGVYEDDIFYTLCDRYGIMVWQDFMFAGAMYPGDPAFLKNVEEEIRYQVNRLKSHPCIVLWCGNNEIDEAWHNWGWQKQYAYNAADSARIWDDYRKLFHQLIPGILQELDPQRPYWPSSPSIGWGRDSAYANGDVHYWGVWWGKEPVETYREKTGRFNSEYGMQGMPVMPSIRQFSLPEDWDTSSAVMKTHQKHPSGWQNIKIYVDRRFIAPKRFEDLVYVSQLMQADAIKTAMEAHRRNKPLTMGSLFWQWNDCWPVTSWSAIDYYGRPKALFYESKRSFADLVILPDMDAAYYRFNIVSDLDTSVTVHLETDFISFAGGERNTLKAQQEFTIAPNGNFSGRSRRAPMKERPADACIRFRVVQQGKTIAENFLFLAPPKSLHLTKPSITVQVLGNHTIELVADRFAYGVCVEVPEGVALDDNYFHMVQGEKKILHFTGTLPDNTIRSEIKIKSLADTY